MKNKLKKGKKSQLKELPTELERLSEDLKEKNPDLNIDNDDKAGSPVLLLFFY